METARRGVRRRLEAGEALVGTFVQLGDPTACGVVAGAGFDYVCIEGEHSGLGVETVQALVASAEAAGVPAIVRVAGNDPIHVAAALDAGAGGVIVPRVHSGEDAATAVRFARYPPLGARGAGPSRATAWGRTLRDYVAQANAETLLGVQVESVQAVEALDDILAVEGIDLVFVGPGDLSLSLGLSGLGDPELVRVVGDVVERAHAAGRRTGMFVGDPADAEAWFARGVGLLLVASDVAFLADAAERAAAGARRA